MNNVLKTVSSFVVKNQSSILTATAVVAVVGAAVSASKAGWRASEDILDAEEVNGGEVMPIAEQLKIAGRYYVPTAIFVTAAIAAIIANHISGSRKAAAAAAAYGLLERGWNEYTEETRSQIGERKELKIRESIASKQQESVPVEETQIVITGNGDTLIFDALSGRYFYSSLDSVRRAVNEFNQAILRDGYDSLNSFYYYIGLEGIALGHDIGWNSEGLMQPTYTSKVVEHLDKSCIVFGHMRMPRAL